MSARPSGRRPDELRPLRITRHYTKHAEGSVLIEAGDTKVLCTASVEEGVPAFPQGQGTGLAHRRIRDAAARDEHADAARGGRGHGNRAARRRSSA